MFLLLNHVRGLRLYSVTSELFKRERDLFNVEGVITTDHKICNIVISIEIEKNKFTIFILLSPDVHKIINSCCLSNFKIDIIRAKRNDKGMNLARIVVMLYNEYSR